MKALTFLVLTASLLQHTADVLASASETYAVTLPVFHPSEFKKSVAKCKGLHRKEDKVKDLEIREPLSLLLSRHPYQIFF
jgi:hypothetical protein